MTTKAFILFVILLQLTSCNVKKDLIRIDKLSWDHGSPDCKQNADLPIQIMQINDNTWILRQNKCINYEAPFLFLMFGDKKALLMDTGATEDEKLFPLYDAVKKIVDKWEQAHNEVELIVAHTHAHGDHIAGDNQFRNKSKTIVVGLGVNDLKSFFNIINWPSGKGIINLGNRIVDVLPIPGHEKSSIALYDHETKILFTGDSFYPGRLYIEDWKSYKLSIERLTDFTQKHKVSYILGNHIEMTKTRGIDYTTGTTYQPNEQILPLKIKDLKLLNETLKKAGEYPNRKVLGKFIVTPVKAN
ncbi:MAG: MBL fold metallo-hydrolase [Flavobacterium sp.]|nr:MBL fold metallo-hydrolase [Pedobacter sp.]